ncbi:hypothetical protein TNCV_227241 [Trichonephila clavipes]|nr:hypothetical protein TNCV_227241 [Trichonephila clavipes]
MHVQSVESSNVLPLVWCGGEGCQLRCHSRHLTMVQNDVAKSPRVTEQGDVNIHSEWTHMGKGQLFTIAISDYRASIENVKLCPLIEHNASPEDNSRTTLTAVIISLPIDCH